MTKKERLERHRIADHLAEDLSAMREYLRWLQPALRSYDPTRRIDGRRRRARRDWIDYCKDITGRLEKVVADIEVFEYQ